MFVQDEHRSWSPDMRLDNSLADRIVTETGRVCELWQYPLRSRLLFSGTPELEAAWARARVRAGLPDNFAPVEGGANDEAVADVEGVNARDERDEGEAGEEGEEGEEEEELEGEEVDAEYMEYMPEDDREYRGESVKPHVL